MRRLLLVLLVFTLGSSLPPAASRAAVPASIADSAPASASPSSISSATVSSSANVSAQPPKPSRAPAKPLRIPRFGELPVAFVPNAGQSHADVRFQAHALRGTTFFARDEVVLTLPAPTQPITPSDPSSTPPAAVPPLVARLRFDGAAQNLEVVGVERLPGTVNYLLGNDTAKWRSNISTYAGIVYRQLYPGIDLRFDGDNRQLKSTYTVAPGADPAQIRWRYLGPSKTALDAAGNLHLTLPNPSAPPTATIPLTGTLIEQAPRAWQTIDGQQRAVPVRFVLAANGSVGFALGAYDHTQPLTIDPVLSYATYLGGSAADEGRGIAVDAQGNAYVTGYTQSTNFPDQGAAYDDCARDPNNTSLCTNDVFITKFNPAGRVVYSTYLGGTGDDQGYGIAVDTSGSPYVTGHTWSSNFPLANPYQSRCNPGTNTPCYKGDAFVSKLTPNGSALAYSTYLGSDGWDRGYAIAVDSTGSAYVTGYTGVLFGGPSPFPTVNPAQGSRGNSTSGDDAFVTKLTPAGNNLSYSTYLGGGLNDYGQGIALDSQGQAYVTGYTYSTNFPTTPDALQPSLKGTTSCPGTSYCPRRL